MPASPSHPLAPAWLRIQADLRRTVDDRTWRLWLARLELHDTSDTTVVRLAIAPDRVESMRRRFHGLLESAVHAELGADAGVEIVATDDAGGGDRSGRSTRPGRAGASGTRAGRAAGRTARAGQGHAAGTPAHTPDAPAHDPKPVDTSPADPNPRFTFEQFVIGDANRLAHAACLSVAEMPGLAYNPLYICGPPGVGKTHLLHSIANYVADYGDGLTTRYVTGEAFTNHFIAALHHGDTDTFKAAYRDVDVLLVDDVQFLERKAKTEEEFFHTFNALHAAGAQIVLTSDRPPRDLAALEDRLRERFASGLVCDVAAPDFECRLQVLRKRVQRDALDHVTPDALDMLAQRIQENIRLLEGALIRVVAYASLRGEAEVTPQLVDHVLDALGVNADRRTPPKRTILEIQERTARTFGITVDELVSQSRAAPVAWPRQVAMYLARELTDNSLPAIGRAFGGRNHSTVLSACRRASERMSKDAEAFETIRSLTAALQEHDGGGAPKKPTGNVRRP